MRNCCGALPLQAQLSHIFPNAVVSTAYGMTEACSSMTFDIIAHPPSNSASESRGSVHEKQLYPKHRLSPQSSPLASWDVPSTAACVGRPAPGIQVKIKPLQPNPDAASGGSGRPSAGGSAASISGSQIKPLVGEVWTRGPHVMSCYWGNASETGEVLSPDGWLCTGNSSVVDGTVAALLGHPCYAVHLTINQTSNRDIHLGAFQFLEALLLPCVQVT